MRYVSARIEETAREKTYRIYISDCLRAMIPNGRQIPRYIDFFMPPDNVDPEEIKTSIKNKLAKIGGENKDGPIQSSREA